MNKIIFELKAGLILGAGIGIIFVLVNGIGKAIQVDLSIDNTSGYLQKMFFTTDGGAPTASNVKVMVDGESGNVSLSGELIINPGAFADGSIMSNDIKDLSVKTEHIIDGAIGTQQLGDNAVVESKIKSKSLEGIDIGLAQVTNTKNIKDQTYRMVGIKEGTLECDIDGHCTMKYVNGEDINFNKIDTQSLKIGDNAPVGVTLGVENNILATKVCKGTYCVGDKPVEIGELVDNGWCKYDGSKINCTETFGVTEIYSWSTSAWSVCSKTCGGGTQTRTVVCKDSVGTTVADSKCTTTKPATTQACNTQACVPTDTYSWATGSWGTCSVSCGGGTQSRSVVCKNNSGTTVSESNCSTPKPATTQACNTQACVTLTWAEEFYGAYEGVSGNLKVSLTVNNNGTFVGNAWEKYYTLVSQGVTCYYYLVDYNIESVKITWQIGSNPACPNHGSTISKSDAVKAGGTLNTRPYKITNGKIDASLNFSGTWEDQWSPYGKNTLSGKGITKQPQITLNYKDYYGNNKSMTLYKK